MKKLVLLLGAFALIGCGEKKATGDNGAAGNDAGAGESTGGESADTSASPESQLIGYWAIDLEKTLKALEGNPPENSDSDQLDEMKKMLMEDEDAQTTVWMFSEKGKFTDYSYSDTRADTRIGWYEVMSKEDEGKAFRVEVNVPANGARQQHRQFSLMAKGDTMTIITNEITFMLSRIDESQFEKRMALGKKRNLYYEELRKAAEREAEEADK